jgi:hypothetical protein
MNSTHLPPKWGEKIEKEINLLHLKRNPMWYILPQKRVESNVPHFRVN